MEYNLTIHLMKNDDVTALNITKQHLERMVRLRFLKNPEKIPGVIKNESEFDILAMLTLGDYRCFIPIYIYMLGEKRWFRSLFSGGTIKLTRIVSSNTINYYIEELSSKNIPFTWDVV